MQLDKNCVYSNEYPTTYTVSLKKLFRVSDCIKDLQIIWHNSREKQTNKVGEDCLFIFFFRRKKSLYDLLIISFFSRASCIFLLLPLDLKRSLLAYLLEVKEDGFCFAHFLTVSNDGKGFFKFYFKSLKI